MKETKDPKVTSMSAARFKQFGIDSLSDKSKQKYRTQKANNMNTCKCEYKKNVSTESSNRKTFV